VAHQGEVPSLDYWPLTKEASKASFECGEQQIDAYFKKDAWKQHDRAVHRVTCASLPGSDTAAGFYSLACITEEVRKLPGHHYAPFGGSQLFPCLQLAWIGVHRPMQGAQIGLRMLGKVVTTFATIGSQIGLPHLILLPINDDVKRFYKKMGFEEYDKGERMFLPLQTACEVVDI
jgi:GNAT superfamily N-acetyltransferase